MADGRYNTGLQDPTRDPAANLDRPRTKREPKPTLSRIDQFRKIVTEHQFAKGDGLSVDALSARAVTLVYDALNEENQAKYMAMDPAKMIRIALHFVNYGK